MSRIRSIKPEFPQSETIGRLSRDARLLFVQLWTLVDDEGRARAASRMLASLLYPYDDDAPKLIGRWLDDLEAAECIRRYEVNGTQYLDIPNWMKHQKIDRPTKSRLPAFDEASSKPREPSRSLDADLGPRTLDQGEDQDQDLGSEERARGRAAAWPFEEFWALYPHKVGKQDALKAYRKVEKSGQVTHAELMRALERYAVKTDDRPWCNPATWLNGGRWSDQPAADVRKNGNGHTAKPRLVDLCDDLIDQAQQLERDPGSRRPA